MKPILTIDIGSSSMRAILHDERGAVIHKSIRSTVPYYQAGGTRVEMDANRYVETLLSMLKDSAKYCMEKKLPPLSISVTSQRSSVVPVTGKGEPLAPFIMWHDKRTVPICHELQQYEDQVYSKSGLRISPVLSAVKMTWLRKEQPDIYKKNSKNAWYP